MNLHAAIALENSEAQRPKRHKPQGTYEGKENCANRAHDSAEVSCKIAKDEVPAEACNVAKC